MKPPPSTLLFLIIAVLGLLGHGEIFVDVQFVEGVIVHVSDGDTAKLEVNGGEVITLRLHGIDTPEMDQPYGALAKAELVSLVQGKRVVAGTFGRDKYGRTLATLYRDGLDVNGKLVELGAAWVYHGETLDLGLSWLEARARTEKRGLWRLPESERVSPWEWRSRKRLGST